MWNPVPKVTRPGSGRVELSGHDEVALPGGLPLPPRHSVRNLEGASLRPPTPSFRSPAGFKEGVGRLGGGTPAPTSLP